MRLEPSQVVALLEPDKRLFSARQMDKKLAERGLETGRYICLMLKDLVWVHRFIVQDLIREKRGNQQGRMTVQGRQELHRRHIPNPKLIRNKNLEPANYKRLEGKIVHKVDK